MPRVGVTVYDLLLSCPGDVLDLIDVVNACVKSFNSSIGEANNIRIELKHWSTDSFSQSGDKPQNILNRQFINDCDLCIALLGTRFGTPTDNYDSGTEEEIEKMLEQNKQVFLYFIERAVDPCEIDLEQYQKVKDSREKYTDKGVYTVVKSAEELRSNFQNALSLYFIKLVSPNNAQLQQSLTPKLVIASVEEDGLNITPFHTDYSNIKFVKDKEKSIIEMMKKISNITIIPSVEESNEEFESEISDEDLKEMTVDDFFKASKSKKICNNQLYRVMETNPPMYKKVEIDEAQRNLIFVFCQRHRIDLIDDFYYLGNLQCEHKFSVFNIYGTHTTSSYLGSDSEKEKYKCLEELVEKIQEYNQVMEYFENIDSLPCVSLQIENQGNTFDEDIDIKLFIEKDCFVDVNDIPKPGLLFLEEAVEIKIPKYLFCGHNDADIEEFSNYPVSPYIPKSIMLPFTSRDTEVREQQEEYQDLIENIFCYEIRKNEKEDIICFNIPYLKQNVKMFFPSYLFFSKIPQNIRYEIRSKLSPKVYRGTFTILNGEG